MSNWDRYFLEMADHAATKSKDPSTKVGAVIARQDNSVCSTGYNGFPRWMPDRPEHYVDRDEKYDRIIHAEMNALLHAREPVLGYTLYTSICCCHRCFVHMLQAGILRFVFWKNTPIMIARWGSSFDKVRTYAAEAGVQLTEVER
jgi:dCMP deaminase